MKSHHSVANKINKKTACELCSANTKMSTWEDGVHLIYDTFVPFYGHFIMVWVRFIV